MNRSEWEWTRKEKGGGRLDWRGEECLWDICTWSSKHLPYSTMAMATVVPVGKSPKIPRYIILSLTGTVICSPMTVVPEDVNVHRRAWDLSLHNHKESHIPALVLLVIWVLAISNGRRTIQENSWFVWGNWLVMARHPSWSWGPAVSILLSLIFALVFCVILVYSEAANLRH